MSKKMGLMEGEALGYWRASSLVSEMMRAKHRPLAAGEAGAFCEAVDDLSLIADASDWDRVASRCHDALARMQLAVRATA